MPTLNRTEEQPKRLGPELQSTSSKALTELSFAPMTQAEFAAYVEAAIPEYARDKIQSGQWTDAEALDLARQGYAQLLPQGIATPEHHVCMIQDRASRANIGVFWYACESQAGKRIAYVYDVFIKPEHRRQGHATRAFRLLEHTVRAQGLSGIGLHVFGHNAGAQKLYARLGYRVTNISMFRDVT